MTGDDNVSYNYIPDINNSSCKHISSNVI